MPKALSLQCGLATMHNAMQWLVLWAPDGPILKNGGTECAAVLLCCGGCVSTGSNVCCKSIYVKPSTYLF